MDSLLANYASSDDEEQSPPPPKLLSNTTTPSISNSRDSSSSLFQSLPPPKSSSSLFQSNPQPKLSSNQSLPSDFFLNDNFKQEGDSNSTFNKPADITSIKSSSIFSSLPLPKSNPKFPSPSLINSLVDGDTDRNPKKSTSISNLLPQPKRVVLFKPPVNPSSLNLSDEDDDDDDEDAERRRKNESESSFQTPSVMSFLSSIPAAKNSATLGVLSSSGFKRRSILETNVPVSASDDSGFSQNIDNLGVNYDSVVNYSSGVDQNVDNHRENDDSAVNYNLGTDQNEWNYVNHDGYGNYQYNVDQNVVGEAQSGSSVSNAEYASYENYGNYGAYEQYGNNPSGSSEIVNDENVVRIPEKRRRKEIPSEIVEVKQDELIKNRPREDQVKLTGIAFGPSYQPASTKGKPTKLHKRKHQITSLYFDMKQKEMELSERRSRGLLTKAETQAKYGW